MSHASRSRRSRTLVAGLLGAALIVFAAPSIAGAACARTNSSPAFEQFGDPAFYTLAPSGSFEEGARGWSLSNARVVEGNETFQLYRGSHSLAISGGGGAVSPPVCTSSEYPSFRLFVRRLSGAPSDSLNVYLRWVNLLGITVNTQVASLHAGSDWAPTPTLELGKTMPIWLPGTSANVGLVFSAAGGGAWAIDDVYIDPYSR
jgi:hypothetical protein